MSDVLVRVSGACGRITLNRPRVINALNTAMVNEMHTALSSWAQNAHIHFVLVDGAGDRGLCAGGDIRALYDALLANQRELALKFFRDEYQLNYFISRYPKPYVVLMDGLVMGGGIGIASHGSHRVVTERSLLAMPETGIGFIPDVGGTYLLGTMPGEVGTYMGLTGGRIGAADAILGGLADRMVRAEDLSQLTRDVEACLNVVELEHCLDSYATLLPLGMTQARRAWIDECFSVCTVEGMMAALLEHHDADAQDSAKELRKMSPTSLKLTLKAIRDARIAGNLAVSLKQEFRLAQACGRGHDMTEGIRAAIVDKDRDPKWSPAKLEEVTPDIVEAYFNDSGGETLNLTPA